MALFPPYFAIFNVTGGPNSTIPLSPTFWAHAHIKWFGIDNSEEMLSLARNKNFNINLIQASADALPLPANYFNFAITEYTYHHFKNKEASFKEIYRLINKGSCV